MLSKERCEADRNNGFLKKRSSVHSGRACVCDCELTRHSPYSKASTTSIQITQLQVSQTGGAGFANKSGWMAGDDFALFMEYFTKNIKLTRNRPMLFSLESHKSHLAFKVLEISKENGVILLPLSLHTSHKLQPLDQFMDLLRRL